MILKTMDDRLINFLPTITDAFNRITVSEPQTLFDCTHIYDKQPILEHEKTVNGATGTHVPAESCVRMNVTSTGGSKIIRQSKQYFVYQPGKSFKFILTFVLHDSVNPGLIVRVGLFDDANDKTVDPYGNGIFLEYSGGKYYFVLRSSASGIQTDTKVEQKDWSENSMNAMNFTNASIMVCDMEWLGVGAIRCGFVVGAKLYGQNYIGGKIVWAHVFDNANQFDKVYMTRASLPIRYEIEQSGSTAGYMKQICYTVNSEGGFTPKGKTLSSRNTTGISLVNGNERFYLAIRAKDAYNRLPLNVTSFDCMCTTGSSVIIRTYLASHSLIADNLITFSTPSLYSGFEYCRHNSTGVLEGAVVGVGGVTVDNNYTDTTKYLLISEKLMPDQLSAIVSDFESTIAVGAEIDGSQEYFVFTVQRLSNQTETVYLAVKWQEWY